MTTCSDERPAVRWAVRLAPLLLCGLGVAAYWHSLAGALVYDDIPRLVENPAIRRLVPPWSFPAASGRPVVDYTFALDYATGGLQDPPRRFHATNLVIHLLCALALYGVLRRTFALSVGTAARAGAAVGFALAGGALWVCHPVTTAAVTYVVQRYESLMGLFYLLTLYAFLRGATAARGRAGWYALAVLVCLLGMGSKETMITAPLLVFCYDVVFLCREGGPGTALRKRWPVYAGLVLTWVPLLWLMQTKVAADTSRFYAWGGLTPWTYARTQAGAVARYLWVSVWPVASCFDYAWPEGVSLRALLPAGLGLVGLVVAGAVALVRRSGVGFLAAWFFLILAPTSTVVPRPDPYVEHRCYLPLMAVVTACVLGVRWVLMRLAARRTARWARGWGTVLLGTGLVVLTGLTRERNALFASPLALWEQVVAACPWNHRARLNWMTALLDQKAHGRVLAVGQTLLDGFGDMTALGPADIPAHPGNPQEARRYVRARHYAHVHTRMGVAQAARGHSRAAIDHFREACRLLPFWEEGRLNLQRALEANEAKKTAPP